MCVAYAAPSVMISWSVCTQEAGLQIIPNVLQAYSYDINSETISELVVALTKGVLCSYSKPLMVQAIVFGLGDAGDK